MFEVRHQRASPASVIAGSHEIGERADPGGKMQRGFFYRSKVWDQALTGTLSPDRQECRQLLAQLCEQHRLCVQNGGQPLLCVTKSRGEWMTGQQATAGDAGDVQYSIADSDTHPTALLASDTDGAQGQVLNGEIRSDVVCRPDPAAPLGIMSFIDFPMHDAHLPISRIERAI
jgi:hypothetical protein